VEIAENTTIEAGQSLFGEATLKPSPSESAALPSKTKSPGWKTGAFVQQC
jgi:hypothetical protein